MHTDNDFLQAILENPKEDSLRLIYADWLEENGQSIKAEWLRKSMSPERKDVELGPTDSLYYKDTPIIGTCRLIKGDSAKINGQRIIRNGFVQRIELPVETFMEAAAQLFSEYPIEYVNLCDLNFDPDLYSPAGYAEVVGVNDDGYCGRWTNRLPFELFKLLSDFEREERGSHYFYPSKLYHCSGNAMVDVSKTCVDYGRNKAGLTPLYK